jgi:hypothetical protein
MAVWRVLLNLSITLLPTNGVVGIDASGFDRSHVSKHYTKRTKLTIQQLNMTPSGGHEVERDYRGTRNDDTKARLTDCTVTHQAELR